MGGCASSLPSLPVTVTLLANDNLTGIAALTFLAQALHRNSRRYS
jgi:aminopeptidase-like protein